MRQGSHSYQQNQTSKQRTEIVQIELKGHWLIEAGFEINTPIKVRIMHGCLVVSIDHPPNLSFSGFNQLKSNEQQLLQEILREFLKVKKRQT